MSARDVLAAATPRPWPAAIHEAYDDGSGPWRIDGVVDTGGYDDWFAGGIDTGPDAALIVAAVNEYEALLDVEGAARQFVRRDIPMSVVALCEANLLAALAALDAVRSST